MARVKLVRVTSLPKPYSFNLSQSYFTSLQPQFPHLNNHLTSTTLLFPKPLSVSVSASATVSTASTVLKSLNSSKGSNVDLRPYLSCSMPHKSLRVDVLLNGGVALRLLHAAGHSRVAFNLKIWFQEDFGNFWSEYPWDEDLKYAKAVCNQVDLPLEVVHLTDEYWKNVVFYIIDEYHRG